MSSEQTDWWLHYVLLIRVRTTGNRLYIPHFLSSLWRVRGHVKWIDDNPYFDLYYWWLIFSWSRGHSSGMTVITIQEIVHLVQLIYRLHCLLVLISQLNKLESWRKLLADGPLVGKQIATYGTHTCKVCWRRIERWRHSEWFDDCQSFSQCSSLPHYSP